MDITCGPFNASPADLAAVRRSIEQLDDAVAKIPRIAPVNAPKSGKVSRRARQHSASETVPTDSEGAE